MFGPLCSSPLGLLRTSDSQAFGLVRVLKRAYSPSPLQQSLKLGWAYSLHLYLPAAAPLGARLATPQPTYKASLRLSFVPHQPKPAIAGLASASACNQKSSPCGGACLESSKKLKPILSWASCAPIQASLHDGLVLPAPFYPTNQQLLLLG
ncbi:hypothetical protein COP2_006992 [Malus domestica]